MTRSDLRDLIAVGSRGVRAKMPSARGICRRALCFLHDTLGKEAFKALAQSNVSEMQVLEILREIQKRNALGGGDAMRSSGGTSSLDKEQRFSKSLPYPHDRHRLDRSSGSSSGNSSGNSSGSSSGNSNSSSVGGIASGSDRLSLREQMARSRMAMRDERRRPQTAVEVSSSRSRGGSNAKTGSGGKGTDAGAIFIFQDM